MNAKTLTHIDFLFDLFDSLDHDSNDVLIKKNVRLDFTVYNKLVQIAKEQDISFNELLNDIYMHYVNEFYIHNSKQYKYD